MLDTRGSTGYVRIGLHAGAARQFIMADLVTKTDLQATESRLEAGIDTQTLRLTVRLGGLLVFGVGVLAALLKLV